MESGIDHILSKFRRSIAIYDFEACQQIIEDFEQELESFENKECATAELYYCKARFSFARNKIDEALNYLQLSLQIFEKIKNIEKEALISTYLCDYYLVKGSRDQFQNSIKVAFEKYITLGDQLMSINNYPGAESAYKIAKELAYQTDVPDMNRMKTIAVLEKIVAARLSYCTDLSLVSNYHLYSSNPSEALREAWRALTIALDTVRYIVELYRLKHENAVSIVKDPVLDNFIHEFLSFYSMAKHSLLSSSDKEITPVIELKLNELHKFFLSLSDEIPDSLEDVKVWIDTQKESLRFLIPLSVPSFMFLTPDGRLIYHYTQTYVENPESVNHSSQHLLAGILMAIRSVFHETQILGTGGIKEINAVGGTLIIESRPNIMVISVCDVVFPEIEKKTAEMADHIQQHYSDVLRNWVGDRHSISNLISDIELHLSSFSL